MSAHVQSSSAAPQIRAVEVPAGLRAAAGLARPDYADAFAARLPRGAPDSPVFWHDAVLRTSAPAWLSGLMRVRGVLARALRLHTADGDSGGLFPVLSRTDELLVSGTDDRHLDFRVVLTVRAAPDGARELVLVTAVQRHNVVGRAYFALVAPFHRRVVPALLRRAVRQSLRGSADGVEP
jgi:hypothetical protein